MHTLMHTHTRTRTLGQKSLAEEEEEGGKDSDHHLEESATEMVEKEEQEVEEEEEEEEEEEKKKEEKEEEEDEEEEEEDQGQIELADGLPDPGPTGSIQKDSFQVPRPLAPLDTPPAGCEDATMEVESACPEGSVAQPLSLSSARLLTREELLNLFQRLSPVTGQTGWHRPHGVCVTLSSAQVVV